MKLLTATLALAAALLLPACVEPICPHPWTEFPTPTVPLPGEGVPQSPEPWRYRFAAFPEEEVGPTWWRLAAYSCHHADVSRVWRGEGGKTESRRMSREELAPFLELFRREPQWCGKKYLRGKPEPAPYSLSVRFYDAGGKELAALHSAEASSTDYEFFAEDYYVDASGKPVRLLGLFDACLPAAPRAITPPTAERALFAEAPTLGYFEPCGRAFRRKLHAACRDCAAVEFTEWGRRASDKTFFRRVERAQLEEALKAVLAMDDWYARRTPEGVAYGLGRCPHIRFVDAEGKLLFELIYAPAAEGFAYDGERYISLWDIFSSWLTPSRS